MTGNNFIFSQSSFKSEDAQQSGQFQMFGTLSTHMKEVIMGAFSPVTLIALTEADPSLTNVAKWIMKRKVLSNLFLDFLSEENMVQVTLDYKDRDGDCVSFPKESDDLSGEVEMFRKAYTFVLRMCDAVDTAEATLFIENKYVLKDIHLLQLPSLNRSISVNKLFTPVNVPVDLISQLNATEINYEVPRFMSRMANFRAPTYRELAQQMDFYVRDYVSSSKI